MGPIANLLLNGKEVLLSASLLKRRLNTRNKWQIRKCVVDAAGNFIFYKSPENFKAKSLAFSSVSITSPNTFDVAFGRRRDEAFSFQLKNKDGGEELQRWVETIRTVIDKINLGVLEELDAIQMTPASSSESLVPPSPRGPPAAAADSGVGATPAPAAPSMLTATEKRVARRGATGMCSAAEHDQYSDLALSITNRTEAAPEFEFVQRVACEHVLKLIVPGTGPVKFSLSPPLLDFENRRCEVGSQIIDTLTLTNRGTRMLKGSAAVQFTSRSVEVHIDPKKFALAPQQVAEIVITASFGHLVTWRSMLELRFEGGVRQLVPLVGRSTSPKQIDAKRLVVGARLGGGTFASVYKATYDNMTVAVKSMFNPDDFKKELGVLSVLTEHANIVNYLGYTIRSSEEHCLVLEYVELGSLEQYVSPSSPPLPLVYCLRAASDGAQGLAFLHQNCILHLDMKPANMLVVSLDPQSMTTIKLTDFGMSRESNSRLTFVGTFVEGTALYMAPEMMQRVQSEKGDVYSLGMCLWEMLTRRSPYSDVSLDDAGLPSDGAAQPGKPVSSFDLAKLKDVGASPGRLPSTVPQNVARQVEQLMHRDREQRPTAMQAFSELVRLTMAASASTQASTMASQFGTFRGAAASPQRPMAASPTTAARQGAVPASVRHSTVGRATRTALKLDAKSVAAAIDDESAAAANGRPARSPPPPVTPGRSRPPAVSPPPVPRPAAPTTPSPTTTTATTTTSAAVAPEPESDYGDMPALPVAARAKGSPAMRRDEHEEEHYEYDDTDDESSEDGDVDVPLPLTPGRPHRVPSSSQAAERQRTRLANGTAAAEDGDDEGGAGDDGDEFDEQDAVGEGDSGFVERIPKGGRRPVGLVGRLIGASEEPFSRMSGVLDQPPLPPQPDETASPRLSTALPPVDMPSIPPVPALAQAASKSNIDSTDELIAALAIESISPRQALPLVSPRAMSSPTISTIDMAVVARGRAECQQLDFFSVRATRNDANAVLDGRVVGAFVLRPSSQATCVALSHVQVDGSVGHAVIKMRLGIDGNMEYQLEDENALYQTIELLLRDHTQLDFTAAREVAAELRRKLL